jgi:RHS repeat-associated protein
MNTSGINNSNERYCYSRQGMRTLKFSAHATKTTLRQQQVRYLPGLEIRTTRSGDKATETLGVSVVNGARILYWPGREINQIRFSVADRISSNTLELDGNGKIISHEGYYPFGGTALWLARKPTEAGNKTFRYSGKERDASGLVYYGFRYYAPWMLRWLNADPAGTVDGQNLFAMVSNNPVSLKDLLGLMPEGKRKTDRVFHRFDATLYPSLFPEVRQSRPYEIAGSVPASSQPERCEGGAERIASVTDAAGATTSLKAGASGNGAMRRAKPLAYNRSLSGSSLSSSLYRYDQRSPRKIMRTGFEGTMTDPFLHTFATFGERTVFTSQSLQGVALFRQKIEDSLAMKRSYFRLDSKKHFFLYKINPVGLPALDFSRQYSIQQDTFIEQIARVKENRLWGHDDNWRMSYQSIYKQIINNFVACREVHIQGPVAPDRIRVAMARRFDYLDLAI